MWVEFVVGSLLCSEVKKTVKPMLYLRNVLLRYFPIYNLEVSFNFHWTFLQRSVIKMFNVP